MLAFVIAFLTSGEGLFGPKIARFDLGNHENLDSARKAAQRCYWTHRLWRSDYYDVRLHVYTRVHLVGREPKMTWMREAIFLPEREERAMSPKPTKHGPGVG